MVNVRKYCSECKKEVDAEVEAHRGFVVCLTCATVIEDQYIDDTQDVRIFEDNQDAQRVEPARPGQDHGNDLLTTIEGTRGRSNRSEVRIQQHLENIERIATVVGESCTAAIRKQGRDLLEHLLRSERNVMRGKHGIHVTSIYVGCLYIASRQVYKPMTVAEFSRVDPKIGQHSINRAVKFIQEKLSRAAKIKSTPPQMKPQKIMGSTDEQEAAHQRVLAEVAAAVGDPPCTPPVVNQGSFLFHELFSSGNAPLAQSRGIPLYAIYAACLYVAARQVAQVIFSPAFTSKVDGLRQHELIAAWVFLRETIPAASAIYFRGVGNTQPQPIITAAPAPTTGPNAKSHMDHHIRAPMTRICKGLKFSFKERRIAEEMADAVFKNVHLKKKPVSIAAAICWVLCQLFNKNCTESLEIIEQNSVSRVTVRSTMRLLLPFLPKYIPKDEGFGGAQDWVKRLQLPPLLPKK